MEEYDLTNLDLNEWLKIRNNHIDPNSSIENKLFALNEICSLFNTHSIDYYVSGGTCLGLYRDGKLIPWDDDIDIDVLGGSYNKALSIITQACTKNNYYFRKGCNIFHPKVNIFIEKVKLSIGKVTRGIINRKFLYRPRYRIPVSLILPTKDMIFDDIQIRIPNNTDEYLVHLYGKAWMQPVKWEETKEYDSNYNNNYYRKGKIYVYLENFQDFVSKAINLVKK